MKLTEHFTLREMTRSQIATRNGWDNTPTAEALANLKFTCAQMEKIRAHASTKRGKDTAIIVSSAYRSLRVNTAIGSKPSSAHVQGLAVDFDIQGFTSAETAKMVKEMREKGLIDYDQLILEYPKAGSGAWVHIGWKKDPKDYRHQELTANKVNGETVYSSGLLA